MVGSVRPGQALTGPVAEPGGDTGPSANAVASTAADPVPNTVDGSSGHSVDGMPGDSVDGGPGGVDVRRFARAVVEVLPAWVLARVLVVATLGVAHRIVTVVRPHNASALLRVHQGLLAWDGGWYESIARHGYAIAGRQSLRFFPAFPLAGRLVGAIPGVGVDAGLVIVSNAAALIGLAALSLLVQRETGDRSLARRTVWLMALAPSAYTLVLGYAEGALLACTTLTFLAMRSRRWWWAVVPGLVAGAVRPLGLMLCLPVLIEAWRSREPGDRRGLVARAAAVVAPAAGTAAYLAWVGATFGDPLLPFRIQVQNGRRGPITSPLISMWHNVVSFTHGHHIGSFLHIPWLALSLVLLVVVFRRLPVAYGAFAASVLVVSAASSNLDSFERYALSAFPLVIAGSMWTSRRMVERVVLVAAAVGLVGYAMLAFLGIVVP